MPTQPLPPADLNFPPSQGHNVRISVINGANSWLPSGIILKPSIKGHEKLRMVSLSFLIESERRKQKVLFDVAMMKDLDARMTPALKAIFEGGPGEAKVTKDVPEQLTEGGTPLSDINAIIWSHPHIDHVGDPALFPSSVDLLVGPGFKAKNMPGYPTNPEAHLLDSAYQGREVQEVDFTHSSLVIGGFRALDYFEDGSLFLLEGTGHTHDHLCGLARTTDDTFIFLAGDACHYAGQLRPSKYLPLPENISPDPLQALPKDDESPTSTPGKPFQAVQPEGMDSKPFYGLQEWMNDDFPHAEDTVSKLMAFDANPAVLVILAHDYTLKDILDFYPKYLNSWKQHGWKELARWRFLADFKDTL